MVLETEEATTASILKPSEVPDRTSSKRDAGIMNLVIGTLLLICASLIPTVTAQVDYPSCQRNMCVFPDHVCVTSCPPLNMRNVYFTFGLRRQFKCVARPAIRKQVNMTVGDADDDTTSTSMGTTADEGASSMPNFDDPGFNATEYMAGEIDESRRLEGRQQLWPIFSPPSCYGQGCYFEGPNCVVFCSESYVYYGPSDKCADNPNLHGRH
jgi:hypothetical protein